MAKLRGLPSFPDLWLRRSEIELGGEQVELLSLPDLVLAKKTQRDKDWPMIRRLVEQSFFTTAEPTAEAVAFWIAELRTPDLLLEVAARYPDAAARSPRPAVQAALRGDRSAIEASLDAEQEAERAADRRYWEPLRKEIEQFRLARRKPS